MRNFFVTTLLFSQALILLPCQAQTVRESEQPANNPVSISSETISNTNKTSSARSSNSPNSSELKTEIASDTNSSEPSVANQPSSRIPIFSRIFFHPSMQQ
ncbi:hypothetical protein [Anabaena azotica]|uniref:Uncharacterized protein n=1 Tax=Anabaena azotica FACHB-119 TaxID=947527 RepID=A0ABR8D5N1_9NOST|nr:hypothetical protein [Anabaena azotica]MBD2502464.1 hypothetical protein [Anabaena azotica FACHB-119]